MANTAVDAVDLQPAKSNSDIYMAVALIGVLALMIIPLPAFLLDLFLAANITIALAILLVALYTQQPLDFSVFPSVLLVTTLFRLALNVAGTRLILLHGNEGVDAAGHVIKAFGQFVVGGNYVVGAVIFLILVIINFVVITKGAGRVAEVAARFTLDAMPGKQMAIDADLSSGLINEKEARRRRSRVSREADFYGSMDGASKFVRGDAVAGILIMLVNIIGGFIIGVWQNGMPLEAALSNYTLLTIGEGLVAQIPALIISTAAGIIVTRSADEKNFGHEISGQFLNYPKAFYVSSGVLFAFGLIPGLPHVAFFLLSGAAYMAGRLAKERAQVVEDDLMTLPAPAETGESGDQAGAIRPLDMLELEVGYGLVPMVDAAQEGELLERIRSIRRQYAQKMGFVVPPVHIHDNLQLKPHEYNILIKGAKVGGGEMIGQYLAMDSGAVSMPVEGVRTTEPVFGLPAIWIRPELKEQAQLAGYTVVDSTTIIATHISEIIRKHSHEMVGRQELQQLLDNLSSSFPKVVEDLVPNLLNLGTVLRVVRNLLREGVSIRDLRTVLETLADYGGLTKDPDTLTEFVRQGLGRSIVEQYKRDDDTLCLISLDRRVEEVVAEAIQPSDQGSYLAIEPNTAQLILSGIRQEMEKFNQIGTQPVLLASPSIRRHVKKLTERFVPNLVVLSHNEVPSGIKIQSLGVVTLNAG
ncbi:flagellar biosynthesis protein FlhA [Geobacter sulfurreducens]|jgi:flagellar biosynthesis protein FlhA|uniref:Flagellar biosynthesis protein FlhA n=1 Tax=Geobacter sulfurreducens (strain ATCC 51573 / DSM 12127 / PCA) TaxID=243231 RepID=Q3V8C6_GEOSL|nr:flagellar biosynthesis protein FlhA [Geobacter sulfurreducens]AAR36448.1 flagellar biogenesis protein FlhA [Geobacter sulfurreducens PCA]AJY69300.1 flagellar biosynthesis protein FlhA [Geobacter sulfurreducens]QVW34854.1 flagellar biosynthesis protein FlhA [Geobacter sulfurreducens]UAC03724.1 flagellar biosynthesis protein FlhA [Geobacter sulfurreducens]UTG92373.1 flagellar biosynthesis protein FlhA [Geobacter sulfurreducens]